MKSAWVPPISDNPEDLWSLISRLSYGDDTSVSHAKQLNGSEIHDVLVSDSSPSISTSVSQELWIRNIQLPLENVKNLTYPYQAIPSPDQQYYLYEFRLPHPSMLAAACGITPECFGTPQQTIGILFSKPIAEHSNVCRIPLYLSHGMVRAYIQQTCRLRLSPSQLRTIICTNWVLCDLLCELITRKFTSVIPSDASNEAPSLFDEFQYDPTKAFVTGLLCVIKWPSSTVDFEACQCLESGFFKCEKSSLMKQPPNAEITLSSKRGILPFSRTPLQQVNQSSWTGLLVRPSGIPSVDLGLFACAGPDPDHEGMIKCFRLSRNIQMARASTGKSKESIGPVIFRSNECYVHPLSAWLWFQLSLVPAVLYQTNRALCCVELADQLKQFISDRLVVKYPVLVPDRLDTPRCMLFELRSASDLDRSVASCALYPKDCEMLRTLSITDSNFQIGVLLEAVTTLGVDDIVNLERLEFWGDSFLKLFATLTVYESLPLSATEGSLTASRIGYITNDQLERTFRRLRWYKFCFNRPYLSSTQFTPPAFTLAQKNGASIENERSVVLFSRKSLSDVFEAMLGYLLTYSTARSAFELAKLLDKSVTDLQSKSYQGLFSDTIASLPDLLAFKRSPSKLTIPCDRSPVEHILGYQFLRPDLLSTALTHASATNPTNFASTYQRLEFLGDAVLDFVVASYIYKRYPQFDPGNLTACRTYSTNNTILAYMMIKLNLYPHVKHAVPMLDSVISSIKEIHDTKDRSCSELDVIPAGMPNVKSSKLLADVFEALIGAVFEDSRGDLFVTGNIILHCLQQRIDFVAQSIDASRKS